MKKELFPHHLQLSIQSQTEANKVSFGPAEAMFERKRPAALKVERETFSLPLAEQMMISTLQKRLVRELDDIGVTRSQVIRAGLLALQRLAAPELLTLAQEVKRPRSGRKNNS
jgi:pyoverdine/dityrosine biosynthesis protein Dit1